MSLTVPKAPVIGGRAANIQYEADPTGDSVARLGMTMLQVGQRIEAEREQRVLGKARINAMTGLNDLQLKYQQVGDPDEIDQGWVTDRQELRNRVLSSLPENSREQAGMMFDEMAVSHASRLGGRAVELRQSAEMATIMSVGEQVVRAAAIEDPQIQAAYRAQFDDQLDNVVARGIMTPQDAERTRQSLGTQMESARARRLLSENPEALVAAIDEGEFIMMGGDSAQNWRAHGVTAARANAARIEAEQKRERSEQLGAAKDLLKDAIGVMGKGQPYAQADLAQALMDDPEIAALPEARQYRATMELMHEQPDLAILAPDQKQELLDRLEKQAISKPYEADKIDALRSMIEADKKGFREDPLIYAGKIGLKQAPALPDPVSDDPGDIITGLRARRNYTVSLAAQGYIKEPAFFTLEEREAWAKVSDASASPEDRARMAQSLAVALGPAAEDAAKELKADPVFTMVGAGLAHGLSPQTARQIFEGQRAIDGQQVKLPAVTERRQSFFAEFDSLFFDGTDPAWGDESSARNQITAAADALYAYRMRSEIVAGETPGNNLKETVYLQSLHEVMGGTGRYSYREARGGVQKLRNRLTLLPDGVSAGEVEDRLDRLASGSKDLWSQISVTGASPLAGDQAPDARSMSRMHLRAVGPDQYLMVWPNRTGSDLTVMMGSDGNPFVLSLSALMAQGKSK